MWKQRGYLRGNADRWESYNKDSIMDSGTTVNVISKRHDITEEDTEPKSMTLREDVQMDPSILKALDKTGRE